jgi:hypothetical protein
MAEQDEEECVHTSSLFTLRNTKRAYLINHFNSHPTSIVGLNFSLNQPPKAAMVDRP